MTASAQNWVAIVPVKLGRSSKSRLASLLNSAQRNRLMSAMARHVLACLADAPEIATVVLLSTERGDFACDVWVDDKGRGLNVELEAARLQFGERPVLFIHGDLPGLCPADVKAMLSKPATIAPDDRGTGTNALALADGRSLSLAFGPDSFARHRALLPDAAIVRRPGLANDIDDMTALRNASAILGKLG